MSATAPQTGIDYFIARNSRFTHNEKLFFRLSAPNRWKVLNSINKKQLEMGNAAFTWEAWMAFKYRDQLLEHDPVFATILSAIYTLGMKIVDKQKDQSKQFANNFLHNLLKDSALSVDFPFAAKGNITKLINRLFDKDFDV